MEAFVDWELPPKPPNAHVDMGPLVGHRRGFRTREKVPFSGGLTGVEMVTMEPMSRTTSSSSTDSEPHGRLTDGDITSQPAVTSIPEPSSVSSISRKRRHDGTLRGEQGSSSSDSEVDRSGTLFQLYLRWPNSHPCYSHSPPEAETKDSIESVQPRPPSNRRPADCPSQDAQAMDPSDNTRSYP